MNIYKALEYATTAQDKYEILKHSDLETSTTREPVRHIKMYWYLDRRKKVLHQVSDSTGDASVFEVQGKTYSVFRGYKYDLHKLPTSNVGLHSVLDMFSDTDKYITNSKRKRFIDWKI